VILRTTTLLFATAVIWQTTGLMKGTSRQIGTLIKPGYCQSVSVPRREMLPLPPTRIGIMDDRREALSEANRGWQMTGVALVAFDGQRFLPAACSDDIGIFYIIPMLGRSLGISLADASDLFLASIMLISGLSSVVGMMLICRTPLGRFIAISAVATVSLLAWKIGDVYSIQSSVVLAFAPWVLFLARRACYSWSIFPFVLFIFAALATANLIRSHAGTPLMIFTAWILTFQLQARRHVKLLLFLLALLGILLPTWYSRRLLHTRDKYLQTHGYTSVAGLRQHGIWHVIYLGFGYINNDVVPGYRDEFAAAKVREIAPDTIYASPEYDQYLKSEVIHIVAQHPLLVIETLAAKLGVIAGYFLICSNVGLIAAYRYPKGWPIEIAFWNAMAFQALLGIVAVPATTYLLGLVAFAVLYGVISIDVSLEDHALQAFFGLIPSGWIRRRGARQTVGTGMILNR
jgi:hypothetical protein